MGISELTALELGKEIKEKRISVREAVQASLERIHKYEDTVHAYVTLTEEAALAQADEIQKQIDDGILTGPLAGVRWRSRIIFVQRELRQRAVPKF